MASTKDGLPRRAFAYAPTAEPATWKLPILNADGSVDTDRLPAAAAALSEGGFRGQKADIPSSAMANVKSKLRQAYRKWKGSDAEYPESIRETDDDVEQPTFREATFLLDRAAVKACVVFTPDGQDAYVVPEWDGSFTPTYLLDEDHQVSAEATWQVQDATRLLGDLYRLKGNEAEEPADAALIDTAIKALMRFITSEGGEIGGEATVAEAGKRHSKADEDLLRSFHDMLKRLGVECEDPARETVLAAVVAETAIAADAAPESITFRESGFEMGLVTLREAAAEFDDENRTVWITPIKPGWGNKRDKFFYTEPALREATEAGLFNNIKMFRDHPRKSDEKDLPERSVKDWFATTREAVWNEDRHLPRVPIKVHDEGDYRRFKDVPEQVAFSVLGGGMARSGKVDGEDGRIVESLRNVRSVDWVTEAGEGGAIDFAESAAQEHEDIKMEIENLSDEQIKAEALRRGLIREADGEGEKPSEEEAESTSTPTTVAGGTEGDSETREEMDEEREEGGEVPTEEQTGTATEATESTETTETTRREERQAERTEGEVKESAGDEDLDAKIAKAVDDALAAERAKGANKDKAAKAVAGELAESDLPKRAKDILLADFREASFGNGQIYTDEPALRGAVKGEIKKAAALLGLKPKDSKVNGLGDNSDEGAPASVKESVAARIDTKFGPSGIPKENATTPEGEEAVVSESAGGVADRIGQKFGGRGASGRHGASTAEPGP